MRVRHYTRSDVADITTVHADASKRDTLTRHLYVRGDQYPASYRLGVWRFIRSNTLEPNSVTIVVETEPSDYQPSERSKAPEVIGYAKYSRKGTSEQAQKWKAPNDQLWAKVERGLMSLEDYYYRIFPSVQPSWERANFLEIMPTLRTPFDENVFAEALELCLLFVRPDWQKRGVGKKLMQWGFEVGQKEKIPVVVKSSPMGAAAYRACGFKSFKTIAFSPWFNELEFGGELSQMWVWEPSLEPGDGIEGQWYQRALEAEKKAEEQILKEDSNKVTL